MTLGMLNLLVEDDLVTRSAGMSGKKKTTERGKGGMMKLNLKLRVLKIKHPILVAAPTNPTIAPLGLEIEDEAMEIEEEEGEVETEVEGAALSSKGIDLRLNLQQLEMLASQVVHLLICKMDASWALLSARCEWGSCKTSGSPCTCSHANTSKNGGERAISSFRA
mmetsp:Transcript_4597/g.6502  ORF Transcript_4597/g.6502 Transcript_4597/m.6502 type:complete len:165 (-) Transcript_4597:34-528(-)